MQLSHESYRTRWLVLVAVWVLAATSLFMQASLVRNYLAVAGGLGLRGAAVAPTPLKQIYPAFAADAQTWVRHALALTEGHDIQLRYTTIDNPPYGREVHWNSAWAWTIAGAGWVYRLFTGEAIEPSIEKATLWLNPFVLLTLVIVLSSWATRRAGVIAGLMVAGAMVCNDRMYEGFFPSYVDHHGLLTISVFGLMLGAVFMGGGWWQQPSDGRLPLLPESIQTARRGAIFSAISGACGLWVGAASVLPPIAIIGASGLIIVLLQGRNAQKQGSAFSPEIWRTWGRVGAAASFFFYLVEYFPHHLGLRLEANHPFYALSWLAGAELVAQLGERWLRPAETRWQHWTPLAWPIAALCVVPATLAIGGVKVFIVMDPFLANLHSRYIQEFLPIWKTIRAFDGRMIFQVLAVDNLPLIAAIATLSYRPRNNSIVLWFATLAALLFNAMAWWQSRWLLNSSGVQVCLMIVLLATWTVSYRPLIRWLATLGFIGIFFIPSAILRYTGSAGDVAARRVSPKDANAALFRDIAAALRASQPAGKIVVLASPNASTAIGYYGRFQTVGTLYWENREGLKTAADIFSAQTENEAATLIRAHQITHIALVSEENFIAEYNQLLHPDATAADLKKCFGYRLLVDKVVPQWLEMIPYKVPDDLSSLKTTVLLFKVNFNQSLADALYNVALSQVALGAIDDAERTFDTLIKQGPELYQPWLRKGELLLARHNWEAAAEYMLKGFSLAPANERPILCINAAANFYNNKQPAIAIRIYRAGLAEKFNPDIACYLAWVLATTTDDNLRNGSEALQLAEQTIKIDPNSPSYLNVLAAALAENHRFTEAAEAADRAIVNSRLKGDAPRVQEIFQNRLAIIKSGKPIRE